ncbi:hypothetical protein BG004_006609 [Podila humilis]|nr:hypothetical protein BG004_006609 [Podila humilis]
MSRHDISYILQKLSLDHRTSLSDKACAFLQAAESNRRIKNHPSHAAICVDIAASELGIDVSREALVYISGAGGVSAYNSSRQTLSRYIILTGKSTQQEAEEEITVSGNASFPQLRLLLRKTNLGYLRQLVIRQGSMELEDIVLGCLETFFTTWTPRLPPAQQAFVKQSEAKWIAAAFWLCAMARSMSVGKDEASTIKGPANDAPKTKTIKIGGRGGKELKDAILDTVEYKVNASELDRTIRLIEIESLEYLLALRVTKIRPTGNTIQNANHPKQREAPITSLQL